MLQHYVFLKFREDTRDGHVTEFCTRMLALGDAIGGIEHLEIGRDELHDPRSWDLVLIMAFESVVALRAYQRHPLHLALMTFNEPFVANVASVDFTRPDRQSPAGGSSALRAHFAPGGSGRLY